MTLGDVNGDGKLRVMCQPFFSKSSHGCSAASIKCSSAGYARLTLNACINELAKNWADHRALAACRLAVPQRHPTQLNDINLHNADPHPHIRSFSGRRGHFTSGQRQAYDTLLPKYALDYAAQTMTFASAFAQPQATILEIGFGMGESTAVIAQQMPQFNFLGVEVYPAGIGSLLNKLETQAIGNVRVIGHDAFEVVRDMIAPASLAGIHIFFPDPWPKARHHKRRLIQPEFVAMLAQRLSDDAYLHCATDWQNYAEQMLQVLSAEPNLCNSASNYAPRPAYRPLSKFEQRGLRLGHEVWDLVFKRRRRQTLI